MAAAILLALWVRPNGAPASAPAGFLTLGANQPDPSAPLELDPAFPTGARVGPERPAAGVVVCSRLRPVCVQRERGPRPWAELAAFEAAYDTVTLGLRAPPPLPDAGGGTPGLDLYLGSYANLDSPLVVAADLGVGRGDARAAYCIADERRFNPQVAFACVAEALSFGLDAAETPALRRGLSTHLSWLSHGPDPASLGAVELAQARPERALLRREVAPDSGAAALFLAHVESAYGSGRPGEAALSLFAQSRRDEASLGFFWNNEPDQLDVLRYSVGNDPSRFADVGIDFAIGRLFLGDRADGAHHPDAGWLGAFGRVRFDWNIAWDSLPRNLGSSRPLEPFGSSYVWLDSRGAPEDAELGVSLSWEVPARFRFSIVAIDPEGRELQRFDVPYFSSGTQVERTVRVPGSAVGLVLVAINLGGTGPDYPFDPDHEPWEPHGFEAYLARL